MTTKIILALTIAIATVAAIPAPTSEVTWPQAGGANPWIPPWLSAMPWFPQWSPCTTVGSTCLDCTTKIFCTKIGSMQKPCSDPAMPYCNLGKCSATPTAECAPATTPDAPISANPI